MAEEPKSDTSTPRRPSATPADRPARDLPSWLFVSIILVCLIGGAGFLGWYFTASSPSVQEIVLKDREDDPDLPQDAPPRLPLEPILSVDLPPPTHITASWTQAPLREVLDDLSSRINFPILLFNAPGSASRTTITLDAHEMSFWEVIHAVCVQAGLRPVHDFYNPPGLRLQRVGRRGGIAQRPTIFAGPVMITADSIQYVAKANPADNSVDRSLTLALTVTGEPTATIVGILPRPHITHADNQNDASILTDQTGPAMMVAVRHSPVTPASVDLAHNPKSTHLKTILGTFTIIACDRIRTIEVDSPLDADPVSQSIDGLTVEFEQFQPYGDGFVAVINIQGGGMNDPRIRYRFNYSHQHNPVQLLDSEGHPYLTSGGGSLTNAHDDHYRFRVIFRKPSGEIGPPAKLLIDVPEGLKEIQVPFEFNDLPLPY